MRGFIPEVPACRKKKQEGNHNHDSNKEQEMQA